jgi:hypothetical protein
MKYIGSSKSQLDGAKMYDGFIVKNNISKNLNFPNDHPNYFPDQKIKTLFIKTDHVNVIRLVIENDPTANALLDLEDYEKIKYFKWCKIISKNKEYLQCSDIGTLHRFILEAKNNTIVDHINGDGLDNRKSNLRYSDAKKNGQNKKKRTNTQSLYIGVCKHGSNWRAYVTHDHKVHNIGTFDSAEKAAKARDQYIIQNFPNQHYQMNFNNNS